MTPKLEAFILDAQRACDDTSDDDLHVDGEKVELPVELAAPFNDVGPIALAAHLGQCAAAYRAHGGEGRPIVSARYKDGRLVGRLEREGYKTLGELSLRISRHGPA